MLENKKAVLFDLDGTLVDSMWMWREIDVLFLQERGIPFPADLQTNIEGLSFYETAAYFRNHFPLQETEEELMQIWNQMAMEKYQKEVKCKPGVLPFLEALSSQKIKMGIATSNSRELTQAALKGNHLDGYIHCMVTSNEVKTGKPKPDVYLAAAKALQVEPAQCLVFEDLCAGIEAGRRAGMETCAVYDSYSKDQDAQKRAMADYYIKDFRQVLEGTYETNCNRSK